MATTTKGGYYAVRRGKSVNSCIFLFWEDCKEQICNGGEYSVFTNLNDASNYIVQGRQQQSENVSTASAISTNTTNQQPIAAVAAASTSTSSNPAQQAAAAHNKKRIMRHPTKPWRAKYEQLKQYKQQYGTLDILATDEPRAPLRKWVQEQHLQYKLYKEGKNSTMSDEKMELLNALGFFEEQATSRSNTSYKPRQAWLHMVERLKQYKAETGSLEIGKGNEQYEDLRVWLVEQNQLYLRMQQGKKTSFSKEKAKILQDLGFVFEPTWEERIAALKAQQRGTLPNEDASLANWVKNVKMQYTRHLQGKETRLSQTQIDQLTELGFNNTTKNNKATADDDADRHWEEMFQQLQHYKHQHGDCLVPQDAGTDLSRWVCKLRRDYKKLQSGKPTTDLSAARLQRLHDVGFSFTPRSNYKYATWEERMQQLQEHRRVYGHVNVTTKHPMLGNFVGTVRKEYKKYKQGKPSTLTDARRTQLEQLGFKFQVGKTPNRVVTEIKSWEERFEQLVEFKEDNGHTVVPQNSGTLGQWVRRQRVQYKRLKQGKPSSLTAEKALKLADIGFVFDARQFNKNNKNDNDSSSDAEEV